jgi:hypothetical protein
MGPCFTTAGARKVSAVHLARRRFSRQDTRIQDSFVKLGFLLAHVASKRREVAPAVSFRPVTLVKVLALILGQGELET